MIIKANTQKKFQTTEIVLSLVAAAVNKHDDAISVLSKLVSDTAWYRASLVAARILNHSTTIALLTSLRNVGVREMRILKMQIED